MRDLARLLAIFLVAVPAYATDVTPYIVNGSDANIADYPSFASLYYRNGNTYSSTPICGATMINQNYALTAAHCIYGDNEQMLYTVVVSQLDDKNNFLSTTQARAEEFYYPDSYINSSRELWPDDIAIIKLETPLPVPDYSALLNTSVNNSFSGSDTYKAVGHGYTNGNVPSGNRLQETDLTYMSTSACRTTYGSDITSSHLCFSGQLNAGYRNSTCDGDSGGPVYWYNGGQYIQIGITSFGPPICGDSSIAVTSVFTDVYDYQNWINRVINGLEDPKAYVRNESGTRTLINTDTGGSVVAGSGSGDSGGGLSSFWLVLLASLPYLRVRRLAMV